MALVEIDPELFIKCRLCIEDNGSYQITPDLLEHIKFCFDIKIELFDGLSQVLCKTCKERLEYFECLKRNVQENQNVINLKRRDYSKIKPSKLVESIEDVTSTRTELEDHGGPGDTEECGSWKENFQINFVCRYCNKYCITKQILFDHMKGHVDFRRFCRNTLKKHCKVALNRVDALPNVTGASNKIVVYDSSTLVQDKNSIDYYVMYFSKGTIKSNKNEGEYKSKKLKRKKWRISSEDDSDIKQQTLRKRIRLISDSSSSDTDNEDSALIMDVSDDQDDARSLVILDHASEDEAVAASAEEHSRCVTPVELPQFNYIDVKTVVDLNSIRSIIEMSYKRFMRPFNSDTLNMDRENMLRRKVLSIGRRVMSKCGIPSNGLLNYCEYNDLPLSVKFYNRLVSDESQYVRILTKIKEVEKHDSLIGFEKVPKILQNGNEKSQKKYFNEKNICNNVKSSVATVETVSLKQLEKEKMVQLLNKTQKQSVNEKIVCNNLESDIATVETVSSKQLEKEKMVQLLNKTQKQSVNEKIVCNNLESDIATVETVSSKQLEKEKMVQLLNKSQKQSVNEKKVCNNLESDIATVKTVSSKQLEKEKMVQLLNKSQNQSVNEKKVCNNLESDIATVETVSSKRLEKEKMVQLLNKTPVANPKTIQKKKLSNIKNPPNSFISLVDSDDEQPNCGLPIITATTSLAAPQNEKVTSSTATETNTNNNLPRIKCKPVTQLMSNSALYNLTEQVNKMTEPLATNNSSNILNNSHHSTLQTLLQAPNKLPPWKPPPPPYVMLNNGPSLIPNAAMVVMESDEQNSPLPITKTKYPLDCLKKLLNNHCLNLIDSKTENTEQYSMLAKYVLEMRSHINTSQQITVIFKVHINNFCLKCNFVNGVLIDMEKLTSTWQWEILKSLCNHQLSCNIMSQAEMIGSEVYNNCLTFYKVLFSIES